MSTDRTASLQQTKQLLIGKRYTATGIRTCDSTQNDRLMKALLIARHFCFSVDFISARLIKSLLNF